MVRFMTGTLIKVGTGKIQPDTISKIFTEPEKYARLSGPVAPAKGLTLAKVFYEENPQLPDNDKICNFFDLSCVLNNRI